MVVCSGGSHLEAFACSLRENKMQAIKTKSAIARRKNFSTYITIYTKIILRNSVAFTTVKSSLYTSYT
jgi:hypothetical protein